MKRISQDPYAAQVQDPMMGIGGVPGQLPAMNPMDPMAQMGAYPTAAPGTGEPPEEPKKYVGLSNPEDILKDYGLEEKFKDGTENETMAKEIWEMYGGDPEMKSDSIPGEWPEEEPKNMSQQVIDQKFEETEKSRYKRLADGTTIEDVFSGGDGDILRYISWYASSTGLTKPEGGAGGGGGLGGGGGGLLADSRSSWYKIAQKLNG